MNRLTGLVVLAFGVSLFHTAFAKDGDKVDPRTNLATAITHAQDLVKRKEYERFINEFSHPDDLKKVLATRTMADIVRSLAKKKADTVAAMLAKLQSAEPTMRDADTVAEYQIELPNSAKKTVLFVKVGDIWYIRN